MTDARLSLATLSFKLTPAYHSGPKFMVSAILSKFEILLSSEKGVL